MTDSTPRCPTAAEIQQYMPIVLQIVGRFFRRLPPNVLRDDLVAAGTFGLVDSLRKNGDTSRPGFEWYARIRIRGAILDELRSQDWLTRRARSHVTKANLTEARPAGATVVGFEDLSEARRLALSVDDALSPLEQVVERRGNEALHGALKHLDDREQMIVRMHYFQGVQFKTIAATLHVSEPRVSQLHARAMGKLRVRLEDQMGDKAA
jgi:RNA polymerase sigma factor for flagellar operon FliA